MPPKGSLFSLMFTAACAQVQAQVRHPRTRRRMARRSTCWGRGVLRLVGRPGHTVHRADFPGGTPQATHLAACGCTR